jgi:hypothetical protein
MSSPLQPRDSSKLESTESESTGLPGLRTWRSVYWLVVAIFAVWVFLLLTIERLFA